MNQQLVRLVVELRHDTIVRGTLTEADDEMNLIMENATYEPLQACIQLPNPPFMHSVRRVLLYYPSDTACSINFLIIAQI